MRRTSDSDWWVLSWSISRRHSAVGLVASVRATWPAKSASVRVGPIVGGSTRPVTTSKLPMSVWVPWRTYSNSRRSTRPGRTGSVGAARSSAWITQRVPGHLIQTDNVDGGLLRVPVVRLERRRLGVHRADRLDLGREHRRVTLAGREPVPALVGLERGRFQKPETARRSGRRCARLFPACWLRRPTRGASTG